MVDWEPRDEGEGEDEGEDEEKEKVVQEDKVEVKVDGKTNDKELVEAYTKKFTQKELYALAQEAEIDVPKSAQKARIAKLLAEKVGGSLLPK